MTETRRALARRMEQALRDGGFTVSMNDGTSPATGFMVSPAYLDVSIRFGNLSEALECGRLNGQLAVYDLSTGTTIPVTMEVAA